MVTLTSASGEFVFTRNMVTTLAIILLRLLLRSAIFLFGIICVLAILSGALSLSLGFFGGSLDRLSGLNHLIIIGRIGVVDSLFEGLLLLLLSCLATATLLGRSGIGLALSPLG